MAQGVANFVVPFFGGMPATGTIARTVTNIRAGAVSPVAGMVHAVTLAVVVLAAAPLAAHIPLAVLAGRAAVRGMEHGRVARICAAAPVQQPLPVDVDVHVLAHHRVRFDRGGGAGSLCWPLCCLCAGRPSNT